MNFHVSFDQLIISLVCLIDLHLSPILYSRICLTLAICIAFYRRFLPIKMSVKHDSVLLSKMAIGLTPKLGHVVSLGVLILDLFGGSDGPAAAA